MSSSADDADERTVTATAGQRWSTGGDWRCNSAIGPWSAAACRTAGRQLRAGARRGAAAGAVLAHGPQIAVFIDGESWRLEEIDPLAAPQGEELAGGC